MTRIITARQVAPEDKVRDLSGHAWTVVGRVPVEERDPDGEMILHVGDSAGRHQWFPLQSIFTLEGV